MAAEIKFAMNGPNMESVEFQLSGGHSIPATLFINLMTEKFQVINKHLHCTGTNLWITATVNSQRLLLNFMTYILRIQNYATCCCQTNLI